MAAAQPAVEWISAADGGNTSGTSTMGYRFKVTSASDIEVAALGAYDSGGNGLGRPHIVAIWPVGGGTPLVTATVPVIQDGKLVYSISMSVEPANFLKRLSMALPIDDWIAGIADRNGDIIASTHSHAALVGKPMAPTTANGRVQRSGVDEITIAGGQRVLRVYHRLESSGWMAVVGPWLK